MFLRTKTQKKPSCFTIIEIVVVIVIIAVMAAIAAPNLRKYMIQRRLNGAARQVMSDLMLARMQAVSKNNDFKITFEGNSYTTLDDKDNDHVADAGEATVTKNIQTNYHDVSLSVTNTPIYFKPRGTASEGTTITLTNPAGSKTLTVSITGRVKKD